MAGYFLIGQQKRFCRKLLNQHVNLDDYNELVVISNTGIIVGACIVLGQEKNVIILDDGISEYTERPKWLPLNRMKSAYNRQGFIMAKMGYCSPGWFYFGPEKYCVKYSAHPEKMIYRNYKEIRQLFAEEGTDQALYETIIRRVYPALDELNLNGVDAVFLTRPLNDFVTDYQKYLNRFEAFVNEHYHNVLIKKHPRETLSYQFASHVNCSEINSAIPAEVMLPYLKNKDIYMVSGCAIALYMKAFGLHFDVISFDGMYEESLYSETNFYAMNDDELIEFCEKFASGSYDIVKL